MLCPACGTDYSESYNRINGSKRKTFGPLDHFMMPYMVKGIYCPKCGKVMEFVTAPTGNLYHKRKEITDEKLLYTIHDYYSFLVDNNLLEKFKEASKTNRKKSVLGGQKDLFKN